MNNPHHDPTHTSNGHPHGEPLSATQRIAVDRKGDKLLGRYHIISEIGQGGMGAVYRCHDQVSGTDVAIKVLHADFAANAHHVESMRANFALVERLHHPHIAALKTLEIDPDTGRYYLVMEYVEGIPLSQYLNEHKGRLPDDQALSILKQLATALDYGHSEKILHRDIKPANVLIDIRGHVKLLDFGIAERFSEFALQAKQQRKFISGTAAFMSPEQWRGQFQDARSDQYALAVLACLMLTGLPHVEAQNAEEFKRATLAGALNLSKDWPPSVTAVFKKALAVDRTARYVNCETFIQALVEALSSSDAHESEATAQLLRPRAAIAVFGLFVLALLSAGVYLYRKTDISAKTTVATPLPSEIIIPRYSALVIGISDYASNQSDGWDDLVTARNDATAVAEVLQKDYGFSVKTLIDGEATRANIMSALDALSRLTDQDAVMIYYAGHGYFEESLGEGYWIPHDARKMRDQTVARDEWLWNSIVTKMVGASAARHVLIVADACYGGSMFRGNEFTPANRHLQWYRRAIMTPSRFLITSGDLEPVLDSGTRNSVFCRSLISYLSHPTKPVFSASDLGSALKEKVGELTDQMVRMGQLPVASHAGGEFVFFKDRAHFDVASTGSSATPEEPFSPPYAGQTRDWTEDAEDALILARQGATITAQQILSRLGESSSDDGFARAVAQHLREDKKSSRQQRIREMIGELQVLAKSRPAQESILAQPRVMAIVRLDASVTGAAADAKALVYRTILEEELRRSAIHVVDRDGLEEVLRDLNLGSSSLANPAGQLMLGKILPASLLLTGSAMMEPTGDEIYLKLIETETTLIKGVFSDTILPGVNRVDTIRSMAKKIAERSAEAKPLIAVIQEIDGETVTAGVGHLHLVTENQSFDVVASPSPPHQIGFDAVVVGTARITSVGSEKSKLLVSWKNGEPPHDDTNRLWIREAVASTNM